MHGGPVTQSLNKTRLCDLGLLDAMGAPLDEDYWGGADEYWDSAEGFEIKLANDRSNGLDAEIIYRVTNAAGLPVPQRRRVEVDGGFPTVIEGKSVDENDRDISTRVPLDGDQSEFLRSPIDWLVEQEAKGLDPGREAGSLFDQFG